ncbi:MAG: hypothetical protein DHS20C15_20790 [Planctomycetota bacterium]|nr:MAG: hypothetical protein DHS20C15_20790 [Planctomycetota bacterium]
MREAVVARTTRTRTGHEQVARLHARAVSGEPRDHALPPLHGNIREGLDERAGEIMERQAVHAVPH